MNKKIGLLYEIQDSLVAGLLLVGTEVKSIRRNRVSLQGSYCQLERGELWIKNLHIAPYDSASFESHDPVAKRKLLLHRRELKKWAEKIREKGFSVVPKRLFLSDRNLIKLEIALVKGKKIFDKRETLRKKDMEREQGRRISVKRKKI
ncbi:MAG: SsrA-binding protein [Cytophagales bacterium]|nr:SsrA-binding protein [Cytophagales bacterium]